MLKSSIKYVFKKMGYRIILDQDTLDPIDVSEEHKIIYEDVRIFTMTGFDRVISLLNAVEYIVSNEIPGDIVECGVWRGGSMMSVAKKLVSLGVTDRDLFLFDTYSGMTEPTGKDFDERHQITAKERLDISDPDNSTVWAKASLEEVRHNLYATGYPKERIHFIKGDVLETLPDALVNEIALLRLDTDWYESTIHELKICYPMLSVNGVMIIDDYGHWSGSRKAVDEYFSTFDLKPLLNRIDYSGRLVIKPN